MLTDAKPSAPRQPLKPLDQALAELLTHAVALADVQTVSTFDADGRVLGIEMLDVSLRADNPRELALELIGV